jgi:hypothetical protein
LSYEEGLLLATIQLYHTSPLLQPFETKSPLWRVLRGLFFNSCSAKGRCESGRGGVSVSFRDLVCSKVADQLSHKADALKAIFQEVLLEGFYARQAADELGDAQVGPHLFLFKRNGGQHFHLCRRRLGHVESLEQGVGGGAGPDYAAHNLRRTHMMC